jgi:hypothetical protein
MNSPFEVYNDASVSRKVFEYINPPPRVTEMSGGDILFLTADNLTRGDRISVAAHVSDSILQIKRKGTTISLNIEFLTSIAFKACSEKQSEQAISSLTDSDAVSKLTTTAFVDLACRRVFALQIVLQRFDSASASAGYVIVPYYGATDQITSPVLPKLLNPKELLGLHGYNDIGKSISGECDLSTDGDIYDLDDANHQSAMELKGLSGHGQSNPREMLFLSAESALIDLSKADSRQRPLLMLLREIHNAAEGSKESMRTAY